MAAVGYDLATAHRCVRTQELPKQSGFTPHFRIFCLATAGRERQDHAFVVDALAEHIATLLAALDRLEAHGYAFPDRRVAVFATDAAASLGARVAAAVPDGIPVSRAVLEHAYYHRLRFQITARSTAGIEVPLIDGGAFDWVGKLASNRSLVYVASGMGSQIAALLYRPR